MLANIIRNANKTTAPATDPNFSSVSLLMHMEAGGPTTFVDSSKNNLSVLSSGTAAISTAQKRFGGSSLFLPNSSFVRITHTTVLDFVTGDFTVEAWVYPTVTGSVLTIYSKTALTYSPLRISINSGSLAYSISLNGTSWSVLNAIGGTVAINTWSHIAVCRSGDTVQPFVNGVLGGASTAVGSLYSNTSITRIGADQTGALSNFFQGYIDEFRITKGVARYQANFTPPTQAFPNS